MVHEKNLLAGVACQQTFFVSLHLIEIIHIY